MRAMPKVAFSAAFLLFLVWSAAFSPHVASGAGPSEFVSVVDGTFDSLVETNDGLVITLIVDGQKASGPVSASCKYYDHNGEEVSRQIFGNAFLGEPITVEISDRSGEVYACHAVRFFYTN